MSSFNEGQQPFAQKSDSAPLKSSTPPAVRASVTYHQHPLSAMFPPMEASQFAELVSGIASQGLLEPIALHEGMILDGWNRYQACLKAGVEPRFVDFSDLKLNIHPREYVIAQNLQRRHLSESQRAFIASAIVIQPASTDTASVPVCKRRAVAAETFKVSERSISSAEKVREKAVPALQEQVLKGEIAVSVAAELADMPAEEQEAAAASPEAAKSAVKVLREKKQAPEILIAGRAPGTPAEFAEISWLPPKGTAGLSTKGSVVVFCFRQQIPDNELKKLGKLALKIELDCGIYARVRQDEESKVATLVKKVKRWNRKAAPAEAQDFDNSVER